MFYKKVLVLFFALMLSVSLSAQKNKQSQQKQENTQSYLLAKEYLSQEKFDEAAALLEDLICREFQEQYYRTLLSVYKELDDRKSQEKLIKRAIKQADFNALYIVDLGLLYLADNDTTKAYKQFDKAVESLKANNSDITRLASYFSSKGLYDFSLKTYQKGRVLTKKSTAYTYEVSYILLRQGKSEEIINEYLVLLEENPALLNQVEVNINNLLNNDKDNNLSPLLKETLLDKVKQNPKNEQIVRLYLWCLQREARYDIAFSQAKAIDKRFDNGTSATMFDFGVNAMNNSAFDYAIKAFDYILEKNPQDEAFYERSLLQKMNCKYLQYKGKSSHNSKEDKQMDKDFADCFSMLGMNKSTLDIMQQYAEFLAYDLHDAQKAVDVLDSLISMASASIKQKAMAKILKADILVAEGDIWEASLTYSQVSKDLKNEDEGSLAKFKNAMLSYYIGDFAWALSQFETLSASTSKLISNDAMHYALLIRENMDEDSSYNALEYFAKADMLLMQNKLDEAIHSLEIIETSYLYHPIFDEVLYAKAMIFNKKNDFHAQDSLLSELLLKYPEDLMADDALFDLAQLYESVFQQKDKALEYYQRLILDYPSSLYVALARKKNEELSKDL